MPLASEKIRNQLATSHVSTPYYEQAESTELLRLFWDSASIFRQLFEKLDLTVTLELACGHGRHSAQMLDRVGKLILVDILPSNIERCRERFQSPRVHFVVNNGRDLAAIETSSVTALFSYDAMVHFEAIDMISYIEEVARVLVPAGRALLHYSNNEANPEGTYLDDPSWRNFFSEKMMRHFASRSGLSIVESHTIIWPPGGTDRKIDAVTLLEKSSICEAIEVRKGWLAKLLPESIIRRTARLLLRGRVGSAVRGIVRKRLGSL